MRRLQSAPAKRTREPSAFAPAVGVKQSGGGKTGTSVSPSSSSGNEKQGMRNVETPSRFAFKSAIVHFLSGGLAAGFVRASLQPLDTCKTRLQALRNHSRPAGSLGSVLFAGGVPGLYKGVVPGVAGIVPAAAVYMLTFQTLRAQLGKRFPRRKNDVVVAVSAALGDVAASLVRVPCEVLKQRLQVGVYSNVLQALRLSLAPAAGGLGRLYAGLGAQLTRDVPYAAAEFVIYENLKTAALRRAERRSQHIAREMSSSNKDSNRNDVGRQEQGQPAAARLQQRLQDGKLGRVDGLVVGAIAGAIAAIVSNPADVVKTRLMTQVRTGGSAHLAKGRAYQGVRDAFIRIAKEEGVFVFGKGIAPRIAAKALQSALFFAAYEGLRKTISTAVGVDSNNRKAQVATH